MYSVTLFHSPLHQNWYCLHTTHYLEREHHLKGTKVNESETLNQFCKTILMLILARVNGYYSPYPAQSITEEEERCFFSNVFTHVEKEFFTHRLQNKVYKISNDSIVTALSFLEKQKMANCPCQVHTASRGHDWVVFRRQPDRTPTLCYEQTESESEDDDQAEDDDYFSVEPVEINEEEKEDHTYCEKNPDVSGAGSSEKQTPDETPDESGPGDATSIHSREKEEDVMKEKNSQEKYPERDEEDMESENSDDDDVHMGTVRSKKTSYVCFKPLMYYNRHLDRYHYFRYFKPYMFDHRLLTMGHDCGYPVRRLHKTSCLWYDSDNIYMIDSKDDLSISEKSAQQKIYKIYMETLNNLPDECGCGTQASISYMGHSTSCDVFKISMTGKSHEVLLAILNKKKKLSFGVETEFDPTKQNSDVQINADAHVADTNQVVPIPCAKEATSELNNRLAKNVTSIQNLPNNPPNPSSLTHIPLMNEEKPGEKPEDEEMLPLVDITDEITG